MAGEGDETKWVGVRPTNPAEQIPVDTKKQSPAVVDLQAPSAFLRFQSSIMNVGATTYDHVLYTVPADKMMMLNFISGMCFQATPTQIQFILEKGASDYIYYAVAYGGAYEIHKVFNNVLYDEGEHVIVRWLNIGLTDDVFGSVFGYVMDKY